MDCLSKLQAALAWPGPASRANPLALNLLGGAGELSFILLAWGAALLVLLGLALLAWHCRAGLLEWQPRRPRPGQLALLAVTPCLLEEVFWRIWLLPPPPCSLSSVLTSAGLFVLWHPFQARLWRPQARGVFENRNFLLLTLGLALGNSLHYAIFGWLWPLVVIHWIACCLWIFLFGGWSRLSLGPPD